MIYKLELHRKQLRAPGFNQPAKSDTSLVRFESLKGGIPCQSHPCWSSFQRNNFPSRNRSRKIPCFHLEKSLCFHWETSPCFRWETSPCFHWETSPCCHWETSPWILWRSRPSLFRCPWNSLRNSSWCPHRNSWCPRRWMNSLYHRLHWTCCRRHHYQRVQ
jgi:hypothetical protein